MERLYQKAAIAAVLLLISFALIVSVSDDSPDKQQTLVSPSAPSKSTAIVRPLANSSFAETPNRFRSEAFVSVSPLENGNGIEQVDANLDDLPQLDVFAQSDRPRKLIKPFEGLENLPSDKNVSIAKAVPNPKVQPKVAYPKQPVVTRQVNIAPAIINTYFQKIKYANSLARRGAISSAKAELFLALRLMSEAIDQLKNSNLHSNSLKEAMTALDEIEDFASWGHDLSVFVAGHETQVLKNANLEETTVNDARFAYLNLVENKLLTACQNLSIASEAFRSLGKVYSMSDHFASDQAEMSAAKSMLMFKLATAVNPKDANAANELAVLYAKYNHLGEAKSLLVKSLQVRNESSTWNNLAKVHQALGEGFLARQAVNEARMAEMKNQRNQRILWTNPVNFNRVQSMVDPPAMTANNSRPNTHPSFRQPNMRR